MRKNGVFKCVIALLLVLTLIGTISVYALAEDADEAPVFVTQSTTEPTTENDGEVVIEDKTPFAAAKAELAGVDVWSDLGNQKAPAEDATVSHDMVGTIVPVAVLVISGAVAAVVAVTKKKKDV